MAGELSVTLPVADEIESETPSMDVENLETLSPKNVAVNEPGTDKKATKLEDTMMEEDESVVSSSTDDAVKKIAKAAGEEEKAVEAAKEKFEKTKDAADELVASATEKAKETVRAVEKASGPDSKAVEAVKKEEVKKLTEVVKKAEEVKTEAKEVAIKEIKKAEEKKDKIIEKETEKINKLAEKKEAAKKAETPAAAVVPAVPAKKTLKFKPLVVTEEMRDLCLGEVFTDKSKTDTTFALCPATFDGKCPTVLNASCTEDREVIAQVLSRNTKITPI